MPGRGAVAEQRRARCCRTRTPSASRTRRSPRPSSAGEIFAAVSADQKAERRKRRRRFRLSLAGGTAAAVAVAALLALVVLPAGTDGGEANPQLPPKQKIEFASLPQGVGISATLVPHAFGTEIHMYVSGVRSGTLCKVFLRGPDGSRYPAGSFRYRWGDDSEAVLSSGLDLSRTAAIGVHAGDQTFIAPVERSTAAVSPTKQSKEDAT